MHRVVASAVRSFVPFVVSAEVVTEPNPASGVKPIFNFTCVDLQSPKASVDAIEFPTVRSRLS